MSSDTLVLDYQNACVYRSDLALLESNTAWLNDACIHFQMTRLASGNDPEKQDTNPTTAAGSLKEYSPRIQCLDPSVVSFFMHQLSFEDEDDLDEMKTLCQSWGLPSEYDQKSSNPIIMLLPINDNHGASSLSFQTPWALGKVKPIDNRLLEVWIMHGKGLPLFMGESNPTIINFT